MEDQDCSSQEKPRAQQPGTQRLTDEQLFFSGGPKQISIVVLRPPSKCYGCKL